MKLLEIDYDYYQYPQGITSLPDFAKMLNENYQSFISLVQYQTENCVFPYFIAEDTKTVYINIAEIEKVTETEATILPRGEYDSRLKKIVKEKCTDCVYYEEGDNLEGHREKMSLDGLCSLYEKKED
ncbi:MAG: hypothetical protein ACI4F7_09190 [Acutalibacteraceae bacterium]